MGAIDRIITRNLAKLEELLDYSSVPVGEDALSAAREAISRGVAPEWAQAQAKGLPLTDEAIEDRARAMGFDKKAYHGTTQLRGGKFNQYGPDLLGEGEFEELRPRPLPEIPDDMAGTVSTYLGPHVARDPEMSFNFSGFSPERIANVISRYGPEELLSPGSFPLMFTDVDAARMTRADIEDIYRRSTDRKNFIGVLDPFKPGGRVIPLRLRGQARKLDQSDPSRADPDYEGEVSPGALIHDDAAVDLDVATHALLTEPSWGQDLPSDVRRRVDRILSRGNPEKEMRSLVRRNMDLRPWELSGQDFEVLQRMLDDYRTDYSRQGFPILQYKNTVEDEFQYAPSRDAYIVLDPSAVRAESAIFDPDLRHLGGLGYAGGGKVKSILDLLGAAYKDLKSGVVHGPYEIHEDILGPDARIDHGMTEDQIYDLINRKQLIDGFISKDGDFLTREEAARKLGVRPQYLHGYDVNEARLDAELDDFDEGYAGGGQVGKLAKIVAAAIKHPNPEIGMFEGPSHPDAWNDYIASYLGEDPVEMPDHRFSEILDDILDNFEDGFVDADGVFLNRDDALARAKAIG